jgi:hypothetical protein
VTASGQHFFPHSVNRESEERRRFSQALRLALALLGLLTRLTVTGAAPLFAPNSPTVHEFRLQLSPAAAASLRTEPRTYVRAELRLDDVRHVELGVHLKGSTGSFRPFDDRPSLTLDFDRFVPGQNVGGLTKLHLNNSAEDPSRLREWLGHELFRQAGLPSPRVDHARVWLNDRDLGLYVLKEGFTDEFLRREFPQTPGSLWEPEPGADVSGHFRLDAHTAHADDNPGLRALAEATAETDLEHRWQRLDEVLDGNRFCTFLAVEVLLAHRDGYALARNNYRVFRATQSGRIQFLPHGLDSLFSAPQTPWQPQLAGATAAAWMSVPEGRRRYETRFRELLPQLLSGPKLTRRIDDVSGRLRPALTSGEWAEVSAGVDDLKAQLERRLVALGAQLKEPLCLQLAAGETATLSAWEPELAPAKTTLDTPAVAGRATLRIVAGPATAAAWRCRVQLAPGRYRLATQALTRGVIPLPFGRNQGAALRLAGGTPRSVELTGDSAWRVLELEFEVSPTDETTQLNAELRARGGTAWFARDDFRLQRLR